MADRNSPDYVRRFWAKVDKDGPVPLGRPDLGACWLWTAGTDGRGYGAVNPPTKKRGMVKAYRVSYEMVVGPIPPGLAIDHLCRVTLCVNPHHLEPVTAAENNRRGQGFAYWQRQKTHCPKGHPYDEENTYVLPSRPTARYCKACNNERGRVSRAAARRL